MKIQCPNCSAIQTVPDEYVHKTVKCQKCKAQISMIAHQQETSKPKSWLFTNVAFILLIILISILVGAIYIGRYSILRNKINMPNMVLTNEQIKGLSGMSSQETEIETQSMGGDLPSTDHIDQNEAAREKAMLIKEMEQQIADMEEYLLERELEMDNAEKELFSSLMEFRTAPTVSDGELGRQEREERIMVADKIEKEFDDELSAQRQKIKKAWEQIENMRSYLRIVKSTDDPDLALRLIEIEAKLQNNLAELDKDYEKNRATRERQWQREQRAIERDLRRKLVEIDRKYK